MTTIPSSTTNIGLQTPSITDPSLVGNFNSTEIIDAELQSYEAPETDLQNQQTEINSNVSDYQQINSDLAALQTDAQAISTSSGWQARQATSSDSTFATATASDGTPTASMQLVVKQLASSASLVSSGSVASTSDVVTSAPDFLLSQGGATLGLSSLSSEGLSLGQHSLSVSQASQAATATGGVELSSATGINVDSTDDTLQVSVDGTAYDLAIAASPAGGYNGAQLLSAVQQAITGAGAGSVLEAGFNSSGQLVLFTANQGSSQTLQVTGGNALSTLGLSVMSQATSGVDGVVEVDGTSTTLSDLSSGETVSLSAPTGSISAVLGSPSSPGGSLLQAGSLTATDISTGNGSLQDLVNNINAAGTGITASAIETGANENALELVSSTTGTNSSISVSPSAFAGSSLGNLDVGSAGSDAVVQIGGSGGLTVSSQTNTFSGLLPGLSVTVSQVSSSPVTISVAPDASSVAGNVQSLVDAANTVLSDISKYAGYDAATKTAGPLMGSVALQEITNQIESIFASSTGTSTLGNAQSIGIKLDNGTLSFDQGKFESAFDANPSGVADMFTQGGSFSAASPTYDGLVSSSYASSKTIPGSYDVQISQSATQATSLGATLSSGSVSAGETLTVEMNGVSAQYTTTTGQSLQSIATGLNNAFASAGIGVSAVVDGGQQLELTSGAYGSTSSFSVTTTNTAAGTTGLAGASGVAGTPTVFSGTDVAGTIDGVAARGSGQYLTAPSSDPTLAGLSLQITATGITSNTDLGTFTYSPGVAQNLTTLASAMSDPVDGSITQTITNLQSQSTGLDSQIQFYANIVAEERKLLTDQFNNLESTLASLQNQSSSLSSALSGLSSNSGTG